jgi:hypothetical protein
VPIAKKQSQTSGSLSPDFPPGMRAVASRKAAFRHVTAVYIVATLDAPSTRL